MKGVAEKVDLTDTIVYRDKKYGFSLRLPKWWKPYLIIRGGGRNTGADYALHFLFHYKEKTYGDVLTILVYRMSMRKWKRLFDDSPLAPIAEQRGRVYAYSIPEELPYAFVDPETGEYDEEKYGEPIRLMKTMVNQDVPVVVESLRWIPRDPCGMPNTAGSAVPRPFLSGQVTPGDRL
jgi:hypothetical protein